MTSTHEHPLLMCSPMVCAALEGRKTQTRRIVTDLLGHGRGRITEFGATDTTGYDWHFRDREMRWHDIHHDQLLAACPYGGVGDVLWVRENWQAACFTKDPESSYVDGVIVPTFIPKHSEDRGFWQPLYAATDFVGESKEDRGFAWRPNIHMPRWACRLLLRITDVRVQRVQEIGIAGAMAEGVVCDCEENDENRCHKGNVGHFRILWDSINGKRAPWSGNPWVWALSFERVAK